jgi:hypothetical protein
MNKLLKWLQEQNEYLQNNGYGGFYEVTIANADDPVFNVTLYGLPGEKDRYLCDSSFASTYVELDELLKITPEQLVDILYPVKN